MASPVLRTAKLSVSRAPSRAAPRRAGAGAAWTASTPTCFCCRAAPAGTPASPKPPERAEEPWGRTTRGARIYLATPRLRELLALNLAVAAAGAMVIVNTVVVVKAYHGLGDREVAITLAAYGLGSMLAALRCRDCWRRCPIGRQCSPGRGSSPPGWRRRWC